MCFVYNDKQPPRMLGYMICLHQTLVSFFIIHRTLPIKSFHHKRLPHTSSPRQSAHAGTCVWVPHTSGLEYKFSTISEGGLALLNCENLKCSFSSPQSLHERHTHPRGLWSLCYKHKTVSFIRTCLANRGASKPCILSCS